VTFRSSGLRFQIGQSFSMSEISTKRLQKAKREKTKLRTFSRSHLSE
jgi:hypothetical protein